MVISPSSTAVFYALGSSFCFATASVVFAQYAARISAIWVNTLKASVCLFAILCSLLITASWVQPSLPSMLGLTASGVIGLGVGDILLLGAFARIGAARTLLVFGFQPLIMAVAGSFLFHQPLQLFQLAAVAFFVACLLLLSFERYREQGHWEVAGLLLAVGGVLLDNSGVLLTRWSFDHSPALDPVQANLYRTAGALAVLLLWALFRPFAFFRNWGKLPTREKLLLLTASFFGTFLSLCLYLNAVKIGHLAVISALVLTGPLYSALIECVLKRKWPSLYLVGGFICLVGGMGLILSGSF